jgi:hypothetical protein
MIVWQQQQQRSRQPKQSELQQLLLFLVFWTLPTSLDSFPIVSLRSSSLDSTTRLLASRRNVTVTLLSSFGLGLAFPPTSIGMTILAGGEPSWGNQITNAITTSDLGISVRRSVVRGAQTMDWIDRQWEEFSDTHSLGSERSRQIEYRTKSKPIPPRLPIDVYLANQIVTLCDAIFCDTLMLSKSKLQTEIDRVRNLVLPSFQRVDMTLMSSFNSIETASQFNFESFVHFKAYSNLLVEKGINFSKFRQSFETACGRSLLDLLLLEDDHRDMAINQISTINSKQLDDLKHRLDILQLLMKRLRDKGLVAASELSDIDSEKLLDWSEDSADLELSLALDGDVTLNAQILLQEQGILLIPSYVKFMLRSLLALPGQKVSLEEYYMDTNYNSNPDLFEVKQVLLNIVLENI